MADSDPTPTAKSSKTIRLILVIATCFAVGCVLGWALFYSPAERPIEAAPTLALAPSNCLDSFGGEVRVEGATFTMGRADAYPDEGPAKQVTVDGFWIDTHEVTNAQFTAFVDATGYVTAAERISPFAEVDGAADDLKQPGSVTFSPPTEDHPQAGWWVYTAGANWRQPEGPGSNLDGREHHPVVQVNFEDALAYASWAGRDLPTEAEYELAALARAPGGGPVNSRIPADRFGNITANTWQGFFPNENTAADGYTASAPVGCFPANDYGAYDLIGNVWEWTKDWYEPGHDPVDTLNPSGPARRSDFDPISGPFPEKVLKGGSFMCAENYCRRYRPAARHAQDVEMGSIHIGFRTVRREPSA